MDNGDDFILSIKRLNEAAYEALRYAKRVESYPAVNRQILLGVARLSDDIVDAGLQKVVPHDSR